MVYQYVLSLKEVFHFSGRICFLSAVKPLTVFTRKLWGFSFTTANHLTIGSLFMHAKSFARLSRNTNKMQLCNRIYYSKVDWRLNMSRAVYRSSSGAVNCICSLSLYTHVVTGRCPGWVGTGVAMLGNSRLPHGYINTGCKYSLELLMMSGMPLETSWAFNQLWNNKFYYKAASCWYFYWVIYDARIHEY